MAFNFSASTAHVADSSDMGLRACGQCGGTGYVQVAAPQRAAEPMSQRPVGEYPVKDRPGILSLEPYDVQQGSGYSRGYKGNLPTTGLRDLYSSARLVLKLAKPFYYTIQYPAHGSGADGRSKYDLVKTFAEVNVEFLYSPPVLNRSPKAARATPGKIGQTDLPGRGDTAELLIEFNMVNDDIGFEIKSNYYNTWISSGHEPIELEYYWIMKK